MTISLSPSISFHGAVPDGWRHAGWIAARGPPRLDRRGRHERRHEPAERLPDASAVGRRDELARYHGVDLDPHAAILGSTDAAPSPPVLVEWLRQSGLWARAIHLSFHQLINIDNPAPILLLLSEGGAALVVGRNREHDVVFVRDPRDKRRAAGAGGRTPPQASLGRCHAPGARVARRRQGGEPFDLGLLARLVWGEKTILRDVAIGSVAVTILSVLPVLMIMTTLNTVVVYHSPNTLTLIVIVLLIALGFEMLIAWSRRIAARHSRRPSRYQTEPRDLRPSDDAADRLLRA